MSIGIGELIIIFLVLFLVVGPEDLPKIGKKLGSIYNSYKKTINDIKEEIKKIWESDFKN